MFSRIGLFLAANFGVLAVLSVSSRVLGLDTWLAQQGMAGQVNGLLIMALVMGFWWFVYFFGNIQVDGQEKYGCADN